MPSLALGDSIALGAGQALGWHTLAKEGRDSETIASWTIPSGYDPIVISMGTNPGGKTPAQIASIRASLEKVAAKCGQARLVWILPHFVPEAGVVAKFARERGDPAVSFKCTSGFHPDGGYAALARDIKAALA